MQPRLLGAALGAQLLKMRRVAEASPVPYDEMMRRARENDTSTLAPLRQLVDFIDVWAAFAHEEHRRTVMVRRLTVADPACFTNPRAFACTLQTLMLSLGFEGRLNECFVSWEEAMRFSADGRRVLATAPALNIYEPIEWSARSARLLSRTPENVPLAEAGHASMARLTPPERLQ